jgi:hypothetical protein
LAHTAAVFCKLASGAGPALQRLHPDLEPPEPDDRKFGPPPTIPQPPPLSPVSSASASCSPTSPRGLDASSSTDSEAALETKLARLLASTVQLVGEPSTDSYQRRVSKVNLGSKTPLPMAGKWPSRCRGSSARDGATFFWKFIERSWFFGLSPSLSFFDEKKRIDWAAAPLQSPVKHAAQRGGARGARWAGAEAAAKRWRGDRAESYGASLRNTAARRRAVARSRKPDDWQHTAATPGWQRQGLARKTNVALGSKGVQLGVLQAIAGAATPASCAGVVRGASRRGP